LLNDYRRPAVREDYGLMQNYPNPFSARGGSAFGENPTTTIEYVIPRESLAVLKVYNLLGQEVRTLYHGWASPGHYRISFGTLELPSGVYIYRLTASGIALTRKMVLAK
jgi:hypothetical protein